MSLAALGCNPMDTRDTPLAALGTIAYSPNYGLFVYVQAASAIVANTLLSIEAGFQAIARDSADIIHGTSMGASHTAFADEDYGWLQIFGLASLRAGTGGVTAGNVVNLHASEVGEIIDGSDATPEILGIHSFGDHRGGHAGRCPAHVPGEPGLGETGDGPRGSWRRSSER